jgi:hypothetical protein
MFYAFAECLQDEWIKVADTPLQVFTNRLDKEYKLRVQLGEWNEPSKKDLLIMALMAKVKVGSSSTPNKNGGGGKMLDKCEEWEVN